MYTLEWKYYLVKCEVLAIIILAPLFGAYYLSQTSGYFDFYPISYNISEKLLSKDFFISVSGGMHMYDWYLIVMTSVILCVAISLHKDKIPVINKIFAKNDSDTGTLALYQPKTKQGHGTLKTSLIVFPIGIPVFTFIGCLVCRIIYIIIFSVNNIYISEPYIQDATIQALMVSDYKEDQTGKTEQEYNVIQAITYIDGKQYRCETKLKASKSPTCEYGHFPRIGDTQIMYNNSPEDCEICRFLNLAQLNRPGDTIQLKICKGVLGIPVVKSFSMKTKNTPDEYDFLPTSRYQD